MKHSFYTTLTRTIVYKINIKLYKNRESKIIGFYYNNHYMTNNNLIILIKPSVYISYLDKFTLII